MVAMYDPRDSDEYQQWLSDVAKEFMSEDSIEKERRSLRRWTMAAKATTLLMAALAMFHGVMMLAKVIP